MARFMLYVAPGPFVSLQYVQSHLYGVEMTTRLGCVKTLLGLIHRSVLNMIHMSVLKGQGSVPDHSQLSH